ncbi:MAG: class I SAM-dependent methyltransferase [Gammaproteobacteria bacterium]
MTVNKRKTLADSADIHKLYEASVQCSESEIDFVDETFTELRKRPAILLREDFCGTMNTSCEWIKRRSENHAIGVDLEPSVLQWGREHHLAELSAEQHKRMTVLNENVLSVNSGPVDIVLAMNFSYWIFKTRELMQQYFRSVYESLNDDGIMFLDAFGGYEAFQVMDERTKHGKFTYIWDQADYNPISGDYLCHIHFKFRDGSKIENAFTYDWRLWTLPEITEVLTAAGFQVTVYWDQEEDEDEDEDDYQPATKGDPDAGWLAYIVALKPTSEAP